MVFSTGCLNSSRNVLECTANSWLGSGTYRYAVYGFPWVVEKFVRTLNSQTVQHSVDHMFGWLTNVLSVLRQVSLTMETELSNAAHVTDARAVERTVGADSLEDYSDEIQCCIVCSV